MLPNVGLPAAPLPSARRPMPAAASSSSPAVAPPGVAVSQTAAAMQLLQQQQRQTLSVGAASSSGAVQTSKGLPMSVLLEVIQQHPTLKSHIQEIVSNKTYTEAQKMAAIQRVVREKQ